MRCLLTTGNKTRAAMGAYSNPRWSSRYRRKKLASASVRFNTANTSDSQRACVLTQSAIGDAKPFGTAVLIEKGNVAYFGAASSTPRRRSSSALMNTRVANANHASPNFQLTTNAGMLSIKFPKIQNLSKLSRLATYHCEQASIALRCVNGFDANP
jgi:hypothetical protein